MVFEHMFHLKKKKKIADEGQSLRIYMLLRRVIG